jgi:hypothetical protein
VGSPADGKHRAVRRVVEALVAALGIALLAGAWRADWHWYEVHATWCYCAQTGRQVGLWRFWRGLAFCGGTLLLIVGVPALGRRAERVHGAVLLAWIARLGVAVLLAAAVSEALLHAIARRRKPGGAYLDADWELDDRYGWRTAAGRETELQVGGRPVRFVTDQNRYRVRSRDEHVDFAAPTILSTGESVASGYGLDYDETYAAILAERLGVQVANLALTGYGADQAYLRLVDDLPRFARPIATLTTVLPFALDRSVAPDRPHFLPTPSGSLVLEPRHDPTLVSQSRLLSLLADVTGYHSDEAVVRTRAILTSTDRISREHGALALFLLLDWPECLPDDTGAPSIERTLFEGLAVTHVRVRLPREDWDQVMYHPNAEGQRKIADAVERALVDHGAMAAASSR